MEIMTINTVKYIANIETPTAYTGYLVNDTRYTSIGSGDRYEVGVEQWIGEGNTAEPAYTQQELDDYELSKTQAIADSMFKEGTTLGMDNAQRIDVGATPVIEDKVAHDAWMKELYDDKDVVPTEPTLFKPPEAQRQLLNIVDEDRDPFTFIRYQDEWGYRWKMSLQRESVNALALFIQDSDGNYLYTTGALLDNGNDGWYTECPAGQADATPENVYFKWILGSAPISSDFVYKGNEDALEGVVRSDERYD